MVDILRSGSQYNWGIQNIDIWGGCEINQLTVTCNEKWGSDKVTVKLHPQRAPQESAANRRRFIRTSHWWQVLKSADTKPKNACGSKPWYPWVPQSAENSFGLGLFGVIQYSLPQFHFHPGMGMENAQPGPAIDAPRAGFRLHSPGQPPAHGDHRCWMAGSFNISGSKLDKCQKTSGKVTHGYATWSIY